tara:strand:- start:360 stop:761 length:402 start_codon:yes stop_codon:yes gene_type:complete
LWKLNSAATSDDAWGVRADYDNGNGVTVGVLYESTEDFEVTGGYAAGAVSVSNAYEFDATADNGEFSLDATYDAGNSLTVLAGVADPIEEQYASLNYALGESASAYVRYSSADELDPAEDFAAGATVGMSFTF